MLDTVVKRLKKHGNEVEHLPKAVRRWSAPARAFNEAEETGRRRG